jgi:cytochrome c556
MRKWGRVLPVVAGISVVLMIAAHGASLDDGKAVFERREDTMKHMGRPLYIGIGRVVKGTAAYGPDMVTAAETVASLASTLDRTLFLPGSDAAESKIKPAIFDASIS